MTKRNINKSLFSLIELIIVLAVIMILMSLLMPSLNKFNEKSISIKCTEVLKKFAFADHLYAEDHSDKYVSILEQNWGYAWHSNKTYISYFETDARRLRGTEELSCPKLDLNEPNYWGISYSPNWSGLSGGFYALRGKSIIRYKVSEPSQKIRWIENTDWHARSYHADPKRWFDRGEKGGNTVAYRHSERCNAMFYDGHIESKAPEEVYSPSNQFSYMWNIEESAFE